MQMKDETKTYVITSINIRNRIVNTGSEVKKKCTELFMIKYRNFGKNS